MDNNIKEQILNYLFTVRKKYKKTLSFDYEKKKKHKDRLEKMKKIMKDKEMKDKEYILRDWYPTVTYSNKHLYISPEEQKIIDLIEKQELRKNKLNKLNKLYENEI